MVESQIDVIQRLIAQNTEERGKLRDQLHRFETGAYHVGTVEVGDGDGDITPQWIHQLKAWITERDGILADLEGVLRGTRSSI
jgi:hypothetical protein